MAAGPVTLKVIQGANLRRRFRRRVGGVYTPMTGVQVRSQIRTKAGGSLVLDLAPHFTVNPDDATALDLFVPASVTAALTTDGEWDVFFDDEYITGGQVDVQRTVSSA